MLAVLLTIHMIACVALVIAVMLQRSDGGALGMGGGGTGGVISGRGAASVLVRTTMGLAAVFFTTSIIMTRLNNEQNAAPSTLEQQQQQLPVDPFDPLAGAPAVDHRSGHYARAGPGRRSAGAPRRHAGSGHEHCPGYDDSGACDNSTHHPGADAGKRWIEQLVA